MQKLYTNNSEFCEGNNHKHLQKHFDLQKPINLCYQILLLRKFYMF